MNVVFDVIDALDALDIAYAIGGSLASSLYGVTRFTADADLSVELFPRLEDQLASSFGPDYSPRVTAIRQAIRERSTFKIINTAVGFKVDLFVRKDRAFERSLMNRRVLKTEVLAPDRSVSFVTPEDSILLKLEWFRLAGETSEKQWRDILGVLRVRAGELDDAYLDHWATDLGVADLLGNARRDAAI